MKFTFSKQSFRFIFIFGTCLMISSCNVGSHKDYAYQQTEQQYAWGTLHASLKGKDRVIDDSTSVRGTPYNLFVWASLNENALKGISKDCSVNLESLQLISATSQKPVFSATQAKANFEPAYNNKHDATFSFDGLDINYDDYYLDIQFSVDKNCGGTGKEHKRLLLKKEYTEKKITFWDQLMGI